MSVIFILVGASLIVAVGFLIGFIWSVKNGQFDDDYTPSIRILFDNSIPSEHKSTAKEKEKTIQNPIEIN